jgi:sugar (pentulose or hexulose) kinase
MSSNILIFDVGKTNKKWLLFDQQYNLLREESIKLEETVDEDGFACEDIAALAHWIRSSFESIHSDSRYELKAVNFSAYGASFVHLDEQGKVVTPLYNYLKPYPEQLLEQFYSTYGGKSQLAKQTASPALGNLNSGLQLYRLKHEQPAVYARIKYSLHLPQYLSYCISSKPHNDITSIGCHTHLWDFQRAQYHRWVRDEGIDEKFPPILPCTQVAAKLPGNLIVGGGMHDSSAALIPYQANVREPFILLSTGTWCISLNPYNHSLLSDYELDNDCLCYLSYEGKPVKASRLFAGYEHEQQVKRLANHFGKIVDYYKLVKVDQALCDKAKGEKHTQLKKQHGPMVGQSHFGKRKLDSFGIYEEAYHQLIADIITQQVRSTNLVLKGTAVKKIFVDGGFSRNPVYMHLLASSMEGMEVFSASVPQASAIGAAIALHAHWNTGKVPGDLVKASGE